MANDPIEKRRDLLVALGNGLPLKEDVLSKALSSGTWADDPNLAGKGLSLLDPVGDHPSLSTATARFSIRAYWRRVHDRLYSHILSLEPGILDPTRTPESVTKEHLKQKVLLETRRLRPGHFVTDYFGQAVYEIEGDPTSGQIKLEEWNSNERRLLQGMIEILTNQGQGSVLLDMAQHLSWGDAKLLADFNAQARAISHYNEALERQQEPNPKDHSGKVGIKGSQKDDVAKLQGMVEWVIAGFKEIDAFSHGGKQATLDDEAVLKLKSGKGLIQISSTKARAKLIESHPAFEAMRTTGDLEELARVISPDYDGPEYQQDEVTGVWTLNPRDASSPDSLKVAILGKGLTSKKLATKKSRDYSLPIDPDDLTRQETIVDWLHQRPAIVGGHLHTKNVQIQGSRLEKRLSRRVATITGPAKGDARLLVFLFFGALVFGEVGLGSGNNIFGSGMDLIRWAIVLGLVDAVTAILVANFVGSWSVGSNRWFFWIGTAGLILTASVLMWRGSTAAFDDYNQRGTQLHQSVPSGTLKPSFKFP